MTNHQGRTHRSRGLQRHTWRSLRVRTASRPQPYPQLSGVDGALGDADPALHGERRQVTVLFCDLVGSTDLSRRLDPEELCRLMRCYQATCAQALTAYGGYIAQTMGDGLLVYFGFPEAHEDDAARAVHAGLATVAAVADESGPLYRNWGECATRVGIHTGVVFAGAVGRFDTRVRGAVIGETPNIAARLQTIAGRNEVLIGPTTRELVDGRFRVESLGLRPLKGLPEPLPVYRVTALLRSPTRFAGMRTGRAVAPLCGRDRELAALTSAWQRALAGEGQIAVISGVAGIGKSRLAEAFRASVCQEARVLVYQCLPYYQHTALYPLIAQVREAAGIRRRDRDSVKLAKLQRMLGRAGQASDMKLAYWARLLHIAAPVSAELELRSARRVLEDTLELLTNELVALSHTSPVLVVVEDAHWMDTISRRLATSVAARIIDARVMCVITDRNGCSSFTRDAAVLTLKLPPLEAAGLQSIIAHWTADVQLPRRVTEEIVCRSEGNPFFAEELTKVVRENQAPHIGMPRVPASIKDMLTARLDSVGEFKLIAQRGACIGSAFTHDMIAFVAGLDASQLESGLVRLVQSDILSCSGDGDSRRFLFNHSLLQDAAYESMLLQERRAVHLAIARKLERDAVQLCEQEPELVARHFFAGGESSRAAEYFLRAGDLAQARSAHLEAIGHLTQGLQALVGDARVAHDDALEISLQSALARSHMAGEGWAGPRVHAAYVRARELARARGELSKECELLWGLCAHASVRGNFAAAAQLAAEYVALAQRTGQSSNLLMADSAAVLAHGCRGEFALAQSHADRIHKHYDSAQFWHLVQTYNHDPAVLAHIHESIWLWVQGQPDRAAYASERALQRARELRHPFNLCYALINGSCALILRGELERALENIDAALALANERRIPMFKIYAPLMAAPALVKREPTQATLAWLEDCLSVMRAAEVGMHMPLYLGQLAAAYGQLDAPLEARTRVEEALELMRRTGEFWLEPELLRIRARAEHRLDPHADTAELQLWTALQRARSTGARGFELRVATDLGELLAARGRRAEVEELVASVLATFGEGQSTADVRRARAWLE